MAKITYSKSGSKTTESIETARPLVKFLWREAHTHLNANIVRVRKGEERYGYEQGDTFDSYHYGKVSVYRQRQNPVKSLYFARKIPLTKSNKGMQILELNTSTVDMQDTFKALDHIKYVTETGYLVRLPIQLITHHL